ncbi:hypothetical protein MEG05_01570 [Vibrio aestuarianus]|uniref:hypothetical protein n=1 Tax=Vibrio aestuarianus TaxID=28171 RepID=UPI00237C8E25|nr:hypothetical protein [Vibrio aestuarianus]MDE1313009.1 hypothetical protein [Vibrio aestuarianus]
MNSLYSDDRVNEKDDLVITVFVLSLFCLGMNVYTVVYPIFKAGIMFGFAGMFLHFSCGARLIKYNLIVQCFIFLFFVWLFFGVLSSALNIDDDGRVLLLSLRYTVMLLLFIFISLIEKPVGYLFFRRYSQVMYYISLASLISFALNSFNITSSTELGLVDGRIYQSTFFNVYMSAVKFGEFTLTRFQSIFYEPGTYAFALLPVIYWYKFVEYKPFKFATLLFMLFLTFSVGAILTIIIVFFVFYFIRNPVRFIPYSLVFTGVFLLSLSIFPLFSDFLANKFGFGIYQGTHTSGGTRVEELRYVGESLTTTLGSGFAGLLNVETSEGNISVGLFQMVIYTGFFGAMALGVLHAILLSYSFKKLACKGRCSIFIGFTLLSFISMGLQRGTFMDGVLLMIIFSFLVRLGSDTYESIQR